MKSLDREKLKQWLQLPDEYLREKIEQVAYEPIGLQGKLARHSMYGIVRLISEHADLEGMVRFCGVSTDGIDGAFVGWGDIESLTMLPEPVKGPESAAQLTVKDGSDA